MKINSKNHKIAIDCRFYANSNGIGNYIRALLDYLYKHDQQNRYFLLGTSANQTELQAAYPRWEAIDTQAPHYSLAEQTKLTLLLYRLKPDLLHLTNFNGPILHFGKKIITIHDLTLHRFPGQKLNKLWHRLAYKLIFWLNCKTSKKIITVSDSTANDLKTTYPGLTNKIIPIRLGVGNEFKQSNYSNLQTTYNLPTTYLLYTGNWREHKNLDNLIYAFQILQQKHNYKGGLVITGKPNQHHDNLPALVKKLNLNNVHFPGLIPLDDLPSLYHHAQAYVFPSYYEGFGLPLLEAMQTGTATVASNRTSLPEVGGNATIYFDPENPSDIAAKINQVVCDSNLRESLIKNGYERIKEFSFDKMASKTYELYNQCLKN